MVKIIIGCSKTSDLLSGKCSIVYTYWRFSRLQGLQCLIHMGVYTVKDP